MLIKKTLENYFSRISIALINQFSIIISIIFLANKADIMTFGQLSISFILINIVWVFTEWGFTYYSIENYKNDKNSNYFISIILIIKLSGCFLFSILLYYLIKFELIEIPVSFYYSIIPAIIFTTINPIWIFQIQNTVSKIIIPTLISRIIFLCLIIFFFDNMHPHHALLAHSFSTVINVLYSYVLLYKDHNFRLIKIALKDMYIFLARSYPYFKNSLVNNQMSYLWSIGIAIIVGPVGIAIYRIGDQFYKSGSFLINIFVQVFRIQSKNYNFKKVNEVFLRIISPIAFIFVLLFLYSDAIISILLNNDFALSSKFLRLLILACFINALTKIITYVLLIKKIKNERIHKLSNLFIIYHFVGFVFWALMFQTLDSAAIIFVVVNLFHFLTVAFITYKK